MNQRFKTFSTKYGLYVLILILLPPALLINLGLMPFIDDEAIRALVALEMKWTGHYLTPTLHAAPYLNKPPLFNWMLIGMSYLTGENTEWNARFTNVFALGSFGLITMWVYQRIYDLRTGIIIALMVMTSGRILFWDAMLGLIDITFSVVIFSLFATVYFTVKQQRWLTLFLGSYFLCAVGFLLKGLPALVFQGVTLSVWLLWTRHYRKLLSWEHVVGLGLFILTLGGYYGLYLSQEGTPDVFARLLHESTKRTVIESGGWKVIKHIFTFPVELIYHFLPWPILTIYFFRRQAVAWAYRDPFWVFQGIIMISNILVYWISPDIFPRYLFMFLPLFFSMLFRLDGWHQSAQTPHHRIIRFIFHWFMIFVAVSVWIPLFLDRLSTVDYCGLKVGITAGAMALILVYVFKFNANLMLAVVATLLIIRLSFNWFVLPDRLAHDYGQLCRQQAIEIGHQLKNQNLVVFGDTEVQPTTSFYLTHSFATIIPRQYNPLNQHNLYIVDTLLYPHLIWEQIDTLPMRHFHKTLLVGRFVQLRK